MINPLHHADLLARLLPPAAIDPQAPAIGAELAAEGNALDVALGAADQGLDESDPAAAAATMADWERVFGLPDSLLPVVTQALSPGVYALTAADLRSFSRASSATAGSWTISASIPACAQPRTAASTNGSSCSKTRVLRVT